MPMPKPRTNMNRKLVTAGVVTVRWESRYRPMVITAVPMIG
jgi:hypothetical protein